MLQNHVLSINILLLAVVQSTTIYRVHPQRIEFYYPVTNTFQYIAFSTVRSLAMSESIKCNQQKIFDTSI